MKDMEFTFPVLKDKDQGVHEAYDITPISTNSIDKNGKVLKVITGSMSERDIAKLHGINKIIRGSCKESYINPPNFHK